MVYDGSKLSSDDYIRVFQTASKLKQLKIRNGIQFKDEVMDYVLSRKINLACFYLSGANLLSEDMWIKYFREKGRSLESLQVYFTDNHFGDDVLATLEKDCPSLKRLKVSNNQKVTNEGVKHLANVKSLEHVSLDLRKEISTDTYVHLINGIGANLQTLSLKMEPDLDDRVLDAIHDNCTRLSKLRITDSEYMTDAGFARLFKDWKNKALTFVDFQKCRHVDSAKPRENDHAVGFCSEGLRALMKHSGKTLRHLNIHANRHITTEAFEEVFQKDKQYPDLQYLEISFCEHVTDFVIGSIWRSCPNIKEVNVFGCMKLKDVRVPRGKVLVGVPNAIGMVVEGAD